MPEGQSRIITSWEQHFKTNVSTAISVDCVVFGYDQKELKILVLDCDIDEFMGKKSLVGELVKPNETLDEAAQRILSYWTGIEGLYMEQVKSFGSPKRHPLGRVVSVAYYALVSLQKFPEPKGRNNLQWLPYHALGDMAFDHKQMAESCLQTLRSRIKEKPLGFSLLPKKFTLQQLQNLYEVVLELELDKRNFRRKLLSKDLLIDLNETESSVSHRPAKLYSFDYDQYKLNRRQNSLFSIKI